MQVIKAGAPSKSVVRGRYGVAVTPNRDIDSDFLGLPRHQLAEAALKAAKAAGASYADLRIQRLSTEIIQLRDGELETAVVSRGSRSSSSAPTPGLPPGYLEKAEQVALQRVALAGYRLADLLNSSFDPKP